MTHTTDNPGAELICPECGYDLRGLPIDRCPECGKPFDPATVWRSQIPWTFRREIGYIRAYCRTAWLAMANIRKLCREIARPISYHDAQRFRLVTVVLASIVPMVALVVALQMLGGTGQTYGLYNVQWDVGTGPPPALGLSVVLPWVAGVLLWPTVPIGIFIFIFLVTGVGSYWFHPRSLPVVAQNRCVALSHYCCAPLACATIPLLLFVVTVHLMGLKLFPIRVERTIMPLVLCVCGGLVYAAWFIFWLNTLRLLHGAVRASGNRIICCAVGLPVAWAMSAGISFGAMPWVVGYIVLMIDSMRR